MKNHKQVQLTDRDNEFWNYLESSIKKDVQKLSGKLEELIPWKGATSMVTPQVPLKDIINARMVRVEKGNYYLQIYLGFIYWLDDTAMWMNKDVPFRSSLYLNRIKKLDDLSAWMHTNWLSWVVNHEFGHLICGHLPIKNECEWNEFGVSNYQRTMKSELKIACEYDADIYAACIFFGSIDTILKSDSLNSIKEKYFFDIGMIFSGLFIALDHLSPPNSNTHPSAVQRFMIFMMVGLAEYARHTRKDPIIEYECFINGAMKCFALLNKDGIEYANKLVDFDFSEVLRSRKILIDNDFINTQIPI